MTIDGLFYWFLLWFVLSLPPPRPPGLYKAVALASLLGTGLELLLLSPFHHTVQFLCTFQLSYHCLISVAQLFFISLEQNLTFVTQTVIYTVI